MKVRGRNPSGRVLGYGWRGSQRAPLYDLEDGPARSCSREQLPALDHGSISSAKSVPPDSGEKSLIWRSGIWRHGISAEGISWFTVHSMGAPHRGAQRETIPGGMRYPSQLWVIARAQKRSCRLTGADGRLYCGTAGLYGGFCDVSNWEFAFKGVVSAGWTRMRIRRRTTATMIRPTPNIASRPGSGTASNIAKAKCMQSSLQPCCQTSCIVKLFIINALEMEGCSTGMREWKCTADFRQACSRSRLAKDQRAATGGR